VRTGSASRLVDVVGVRQRASSATAAVPMATVCDTSRMPYRLLEEAGGDLAEGDPCRGLAGRGALEDRAGVVEAVLLHADEIGVAGARPSERPVAGDLLLGVDVVRRGIRLVGRPGRGS
jgi:hypothetical protein